MIKDFNKNEKRDDAIKLALLVLAIFIGIWLMLPPGDKAAQLGYSYNNLTYFLFAKNDNKKEVVFHRNQAVYLARMGKQKAAMLKINKAIDVACAFADDRQMEKLYSDRAMIKLYFKDYKGALNDFLKAGKVDMSKQLIMSQLYKLNGNKKLALSACNGLIAVNEKGYSGYACLADLYASVGRYDVSVKVYDLYLDRVSNKARGLADRSYYKSLMGDTVGADADLKAAKNLSSNIKNEITILEEALNPKYLNLPIM